MHNDARFLPIGRSLSLDLHQAASDAEANDDEGAGLWVQGDTEATAGSSAPAGAAASGLARREMQTLAVRLEALEKTSSADSTDVQQRLERLENGVLSIAAKLDLLLAK